MNEVAETIYQWHKGMKVLHRDKDEGRPLNYHILVSLWEGTHLILTFTMACSWKFLGK
jgi:hypothetical protein